MPIQQTTYAAPRADLGEAIRECNLSGEGFIATQVLPIREVTKEAATMSVLTRENLKRKDTKHANGSTYNRVNMITEDKAYACVGYGLEAVLTDKDRANYASDLDAELELTDVINNNLLIELEARVAALVFNTSTWTGAALTTDYSGAPWDIVSSDAVSQINVAKEKVRANTGYKADTLIISEVQLCNLLANDDIVSRFPGAAIITEDMLRAGLASIFGLKNLLVGGKVYDSAKEGQDFVGADIWSDDYAMVCRLCQGSVTSGGLGRIPLWTPLTPDISTVEQYRDETVKGDVFRVEHNVDELIFDPYFGHLLTVDA